MMNFYMPVRLITGKNCIREHAAELKAFGRRCLIVTGAGSAKRSGALDDVIAALTEDGIAYTVYDGICANPTVQSCMEAGKLGAESGAEFIFGIGGGSVLDAAKAVAVFAANPDMGEEEFYTAKWPCWPLPTVLAGTTAGTGSEVTNVAVLTDSRARKHSIHASETYAALSFGDASYTRSMPLSVTLSTGADALAHCAESYFSRKANTLSRAFAAEGIRLLRRPLAKAAAGEALDDADRETMYEGSLFGGLAISVTGTCFPHNVGYYLTENYGVPHGTACAVFHPAFIDHCQRVCPGIVAAFSEETGLTAEEYKALVRSALPERTVRLTPAEIKAALPRWENNGTVNNTPGGMSVAEIEAVLTGLFV